MTVYLTSFKRHWATPSAQVLPAYSIAAYQPAWCPQLPKLDVFDIRDENGQWVRPRNFLPSPEILADGGEIAVLARFANTELLRRYHDTLLKMYQKRWSQQTHWEEGTEGAHFGGRVCTAECFIRYVNRVQHTSSLISDVALCCWCPYNRAAQRQLADYGSFVCHSWPVETFLKELGIEVKRDKDRERMVRL